MKVPNNRELGCPELSTLKLSDEILALIYGKYSRDGTNPLTYVEVLGVLEYVKYEVFGHAEVIGDAESGE